MIDQKKKSVFIVEDEIFLSKVWKAKLEKEGFEIIEDSTGAKAFETIEKKLPNLVLLDVGLPAGSGFEILQKIKANAKTKDIPVIINSRLDDSEDIEIGKTYGAVAFLSKGKIQFKDVISAVKKYIK